MRGMKVFEAQPMLQPVRQNLADGGMVSRIRGAFGLGTKEDAKDKRGALPGGQGASAAPAPAPSPAPAPAPEPRSAIGQYSAGSALKRRMAEIDGYANGGPVRGPGTGTSDSIPDEVGEGTYIMPADSTAAIGERALAGMGARGMGAIAGQQAQAGTVSVNLSNGEFKMPPEQVHAVGVQALDRMKDATHKPAGRRDRGMRPELFFADGGVVDEENARRFAKVPETIGQQPAAAPAPAAPQGMSDAQRNQATTAAQPAAAPVPATQVEGWRTKAVMDGAAQDAQAAWDRGGVEGVAGAAGAVARGAITAIPTAAGEFAYNTVAPLAGSAKGFWNGLTGGGDAPAAAPTAAPKSPAPAAVAPPVATSAAQPGSPAASPETQVMPGVYQHGRGQYSDNAAGMGFASGFTGQPSAQNMAAADALAGRQQQESLDRVTARGMGAVGGPGSGPVEPGSFTGGYSGAVGQPSGNGNMWGRTPEQQRRDAEVQASSIHRQTASNGRAALQAMNARELEGVRGQNSLAQAELNAQAGLLRTGMEQQGANQRSTAQAALEQQKINQAGVTQGFANRDGQRKEKLYERYDAAKTDQERSAIAQQIRDLSGKPQESPWKVHVTPSVRNQDGSTTEGSVIRQNTQTGQVERVDMGGAAKKPPLAVGSTSTVNGKTAVWDGTKWVPR